MTEPPYDRSEVPAVSKPEAAARPRLLQGAGLQPHAWWIHGHAERPTVGIDSVDNFIHKEQGVPGLEQSDDQIEDLELRGALGRIRPTAVVASPPSPDPEAGGFLDEDTVDEEWDDDDDFVIGPFRASASPDTIPRPDHSVYGHGVAAPEQADETPAYGEFMEAPQESTVEGESESLESQTESTEQPAAPAEEPAAVESKPLNRLKPMVPIIPPRHRDLAAASGLAPSSSPPTPSVPGADELSQLAAELSRATAKGGAASSPWAKLGPITSNVTGSGNPGDTKPVLSQTAHSAGPESASGKGPGVASKTPWPERQLPKAKPREPELEVKPQPRKAGADEDRGASAEQSHGRPWWHPVLGLLMLGSLPLMVWSWATFGDSVLPERNTSKPEPAAEVIEQPQPPTEDMDQDDSGGVGRVPELLLDDPLAADNVEGHPAGDTNQVDEPVEAEQLEQGEAATEESIPRATPVHPESLMPILE